MTHLASTFPRSMLSFSLTNPKRLRSTSFPCDHGLPCNSDLITSNYHQNPRSSCGSSARSPRSLSYPTGSKSVSVILRTSTSNSFRPSFLTTSQVSRVLISTISRLRLQSIQDTARHLPIHQHHTINPRLPKRTLPNGLRTTLTNFVTTSATTAGHTTTKRIDAETIEETRHVTSRAFSLHKSVSTATITTSPGHPLLLIKPRLLHSLHTATSQRHIHPHLLHISPTNSRRFGLPPSLHMDLSNHLGACD